MLADLHDQVPDPLSALAPVDRQLEQAEAALAVREAGQAISLAQAASVEAERIAQRVTELARIKQAIAQAREGATSAEAEGYQVEAGLALLAQAEVQLRQAGAALSDTNDQAALAALEAAARLQADGQLNSAGLPELRAQNEAQLAALQQAGEELPALIAEGARVFDLVDEFAEATWSDIRGNGSEAEDAAERAQELWERAAESNSMEVQEFVAAQADLAVAAEQIELARSLLNAIHLRLRALEQARDAARTELAEAEQMLQQAREFVRSHDTDVSADADQRLQNASTLLAEAQAQLQESRPNWLVLVRQARAAEAEANQVLAAAHDQVEQIARLRTQLTRLSQSVGEEVRKLQEFARVHSDDLEPETRQAIVAIQRDMAAVLTHTQRAEQLEDQQRRALLEQTLALLNEVDQRADTSYAQAYQQFQLRERFRKQLQEAVERASATILRAEQRLASYRHFLPQHSEAEQLLQRARAQLQSLGPVRSEAELQQALQIVRAAEQDALRADQSLQSFAQARQQQQQQGDMTDVLIGMAIGSVLNNGRRSHHQSWGSGGSQRSRSSSGGSSRSRSFSGGGW